MAKGFYFKLNRAGVRELMKSPEMQSALVSYAGQVADRAGDGYDVRVGKKRANVSVETVTKKSIKDNLKNNTLLKALYGGKKR